MATGDGNRPTRGRSAGRVWKYGPVIEASLRLAAIGAVVMLAIAILEKLAS